MFLIYNGLSVFEATQWFYCFLGYLFFLSVILVKTCKDSSCVVFLDEFLLVHVCCFEFEPWSFNTVAFYPTLLIKFYRKSYEFFVLTICQMLLSTSWYEANSVMKSYFVFSVELELWDHRRQIRALEGALTTHQAQLVFYFC